MDPDYARYSLNELYEALEHIDASRYPQRASQIRWQIAQHEQHRGYVSETQVQATPPDKHLSEPLHPNWFVRYWKGQLSLPVSYWLVGVTVSIFTVLYAEFLTNQIHDVSQRWELGVYILMLYPVLVPLAIWQFVGLYRSADNHTARGGEYGWALVVKVLVIIGTLRFGYDVYQHGLPTINEGLSLLTKQSDRPPTRTRVRNQGQELELYGGIEIGSEKILMAALDANPDVKILHLHSMGGRILEAKRLAALVRKTQLDTYVKESCSSACTIVYLAGKRKLLAEGAKLNFHAGEMGGYSTHESSEFTSQLTLHYEEAGVPEWFISKVVATPNSTLWTPTVDELKRARIIDEVVDPDDYGFSGYGEESDLTADSVEKGLLTHEYLQAMKRQDPDFYAQIVSLNLNGMKVGSPLNAITAEYQHMLGSRIPYYLKHADNQSLVNYWQVLIKQMKLLQADYPLTCASFSFPEIIPLEHHIGNAGILPETAYQEELDALAGLISSFRPAREVYGEDKQQALIQTLLQHIKEQDERLLNVIASSEDYLDDPKALCAAGILLNEGFAGFDIATSGTLLRTINTD